MLKTGWKDVKQVSLYEMVMVTCTCPRQKWETICVSAPSLEERPCLGAARPVNWSQWDDSVSSASYKHLSTNHLFSIECNDRISKSNLCWGCNPINYWHGIHNPSIQKDPNWSPLGVPSLILRWMGAKRGGSYPLCSVARPCERPINAQGRWRFPWKVASKCSNQNLRWYKL